MGNRAARFWNDVQGLPPGNHSGNSALRRVAPVHSGAGKFDGRENRGSAHRKSPAEKRKVQLRDRAHHPRISGFDYRQIFIGLFDAAAPVLRVARRGRGGAWFSSGSIPGLRKILPAQSDYGGKTAPNYAIRGALLQRGGGFFPWVFPRKQFAPPLSKPEKTPIRASRN